MKYKLLTLLSIISFFCVTSKAQDTQNDPKVILNDARMAYYSSGGITADFSLNMVDHRTNDKYNFVGKISMKGDKFKMDIPGITTWFNGKTQWVYIKDSNEVNISNPSDEELQDITPSALFNLYENNYQLSYNGEKRVNGKKIVEIELVPVQKRSEIKRIVVQIDKATDLLTSIKIINKSQFENELTIKKMQTKINISDETFVFNGKNYPKVEVIDLR